MLDGILSEPFRDVQHVVYVQAGGREAEQCLGLPIVATIKNIHQIIRAIASPY